VTPRQRLLEPSACRPCTTHQWASERGESVDLNRVVQQQARLALR
jgi:hypothetical protein